MIVRGNTVTLPGSGTGMQLDFLAASEVSKNRITGARDGLTMYSTSGQTLVANNFIQADYNPLFVRSPAGVRVLHVGDAVAT